MQKLRNRFNNKPPGYTSEYGGKQCPFLAYSCPCRVTTVWLVSGGLRLFLCTEWHTWARPDLRYNNRHCTRAGINKIQTLFNTNLIYTPWWLVIETISKFKKQIQSFQSRLSKTSGVASGCLWGDCMKCMEFIDSENFYTYDGELLLVYVV